jgi:hypothetical protein
MSFFASPARTRRRESSVDWPAPMQFVRLWRKPSAQVQKTWHAYMSSSTVDAKTRIGNGPWFKLQRRTDCGERSGPAQRQQQNFRLNRTDREGHRSDLSGGNPPAAPAASSFSTT